MELLREQQITIAKDVKEIHDREYGKDYQQDVTKLKTSQERLEPLQKANK